ncbi:MAG: acetoin:2,6-dichlorophenolindophenol oxidoreductase subunit alpha [Solirubrobacteraceae bacterium]|jgi:TPP-dependent pyruvate/acetoin dehydrogenase alpha subunit|nr:acetoin:2,6-dichlorophenolindophenol oxidoreductase subunit alpha [Solirubrobacteraceae bacterium]
MAEVQGERSGDELIDMLRRMLRIRRFEEKLALLFKRGRLPGFVHLYIGQEASAVGVCSALRDDDRITSTHRGHGHLIAKGADIRGMMAELLGREDGLCHGKGGSMHIVDFGLGIMGTNGIVGGGIPIAVGSAWGDKQLGRDSVSVPFFGDGASNQGVFLEGMNLAAIWKLPVVFVCENNGYTEWTATSKLTAGPIAERGHPLGIPGQAVDGNDVLAVNAVMAEAVARARAGDGPSIIETVTYRWHGHNEGEEVFSGRYRPDDEIAEWKDRDPIVRMRAVLAERGVLDADGAEAIDREETERVEEALTFAEASPTPHPDEALAHLYADRPAAPEADGHPASPDVDQTPPAESVPELATPAGKVRPGEV